MIRKILIPVDVSADNPGKEAMALAKELAASHYAKLALLAVRESMPGYVSVHLPEGVEEKVLTGVAQRLDEIATRNGMPDSAEKMVRTGNPAAEILQAAKDIDADMIVISSYDPGVADYFIGSVAARVVRHAHCSVLVVR
jgi:universal stress protein F